MSIFPDPSPRRPPDGAGAERPPRTVDGRPLPGPVGEPSAQAAPVFTDFSGRRLRRMRLIGLGAGAAMVACLVVMAVGLLGGPKASFIPWTALNAGSSASPAATPTPHRGAVRPSATPGPAFAAPPSAGPSAGPSTSGSPAGGATSPASSAGPTPTATNGGGKTPPGRNRSPSPHPSPSKAAGVV